MMKLWYRSRTNQTKSLIIPWCSLYNCQTTLIMHGDLIFYCDTFMYKPYCKCTAGYIWISVAADFMLRLETFALIPPTRCYTISISTECVITEMKIDIFLKSWTLTRLLKSYSSLGRVQWRWLGYLLEVSVQVLKHKELNGCWVFGSSSPDMGVLPKNIQWHLHSTDYLGIINTKDIKSKMLTII